MAYTLYESDNYCASKLRVGSTVEDKSTGGCVYFQPGDDQEMLFDSIDALIEVGDNKRDMIFDTIMGEYFACGS